MEGLKIASFNVSGGFYIGNEKQEYLDRARVDKVDDGLLHQIIDIINKENIDVICFQEIITTKEIKYLETIANETELKNFDYYELSECNIVKDTRCGLAVFSRFPIQTIKKEFFPNPKLSKTTSSGNTYYTYDKGYMISDITIDNYNVLRILTHHGFPYRRFNSTPEDNKKVFDFFDNVIIKNNVSIVTGDFNAENFMDLMPKTSKVFKRTINEITTVDDKKFDDILLHKEVKFSKKIVKLLSDHFIVIDEI